SICLILSFSLPLLFHLKSNLHYRSTLAKSHRIHILDVHLGHCCWSETEAEIEKRQENKGGFNLACAIAFLLSEARERDSHFKSCRYINIALGSLGSLLLVGVRVVIAFWPTCLLSAWKRI